LDWSYLNSCPNINETVDIENNVSNSVFDTCVSTYYPSIRIKPQVWP